MTKGLIFDIRRYAVHDGPGIRTAVFFKGCPMRCAWCHNPEGISTRPQKMTRDRMINGRKKQVEETVGEWMAPREVIDLLMKDYVFYEESGGGVTFTGGEPLARPDFLMDLLKLSKKHGLHTALDTSGYAPADVFLQVAGQADMLLFDLKTTDNAKHLSYTGVDAGMILHNLLSLREDGPELIVRVPVIPGFNDQISEMEPLRDTLLQVNAHVQRVDLLPYHKWGRHKYEALQMKAPGELPPVDEQIALPEIMKVFSDAGFSVKKGG